MTSTDRAFIAAFRREAVPPSSTPTRSLANAPHRNLPGTGVEVVTFSTTTSSRPAPHLLPQPSPSKPPVTPQEVAKKGLEKQPQHTLHPPHKQTGPIAIARRPLSTITAKSEVNEDFQPEIVVPRLRWPAVCSQLATDYADRMSAVLETLAKMTGKETKIVGIVGTSLGTGCTTLTLALARQAARLGRRIAIVEADAALPSLHDQFSLTTAKRGLCDVLAGQATLPQVCVAAHDDRVTLVPWGTAPAISIDARKRLQLSLAAGRLRFASDLVLADLGTPTFTNRYAIELFTALHGDALLVVAPEHCPPGRLTEMQRQLESNGRPVLGVIQNGSP